MGQLSGRLREQARSHSWNGCVQLEMGRLSGRHRQQAGSYNSESVQPCGEAAPLNTMSVSSSTAFDLRARRQAEWRDLSGGGSAATVWRSQTQREEVQRSQPEALRPDQSRSEGTPSPSERAERRSKRFWLLFRRL